MKETRVIIDDTKGCTEDELNTLFRELTVPDTTVTVNDFVKIDKDSFIVVARVDAHNCDDYFIILDGAFHAMVHLDAPTKTIRELMTYFCELDMEVEE